MKYLPGPEILWGLIYGIIAWLAKKNASPAHSQQGPGTGTAYRVGRIRF